jgi:hypothetical protein
MAMTAAPACSGQSGLEALDRVYGQAYDLAVIRGWWVACGLGTGHWLVAGSAAELERLIAADTGAR